MFSCGLRLGGWGVVRAWLLERKLEGMCPRMCLGDGNACLRDNGRAARPSRSPPRPEPASQGRPAQTPHRRESQAGADVSAGLCGRSASQPRRRGSSLGRQAVPSFPTDAVSTDRSCRPFRGEALLLASRKVTVQIGYCCWLEPGSHLLQKMI